MPTKKSKSTKRSNVNTDVQFILANERTLLAWIRTALTVIAGGVAVAFIYADSPYLALAGIATVTFGAILALIGYFRYRTADDAMRAGKLPPSGMSGLITTIGVAAFAVILIIARTYDII